MQSGTQEILQLLPLAADRPGKGRRLLPCRLRRGELAAEEMHEPQQRPSPGQASLVVLRLERGDGVVRLPERLFRPSLGIGEDPQASSTPGIATS